ncbi:unnamed protein product [Spirodela intermedia]|uniref:Reverse transcriptase Ty1/copia-type domain-containing protein n=1 Tax=Spirodela intermedia TaxID=51605 RepID=A0A7I8JFC2_SPIIN|nr:unnamed protein product [Spirodela intermedia]CAA6668850.1 unnamed protein product [Spirodela intermedia]
MDQASKYLVSLGFSRSKNEQVVYLKWSDKSHLIIRVYVDDLLVIGEKDSDINEFKDQMMQFFEMSTIDYGLVYEKGQTEVNLVGYSDSDFAGDVDDRESTSRQAFFLGEMLICWASQK